MMTLEVLVVGFGDDLAKRKSPKATVFGLAPYVLLSFTVLWRADLKAIIYHHHLSPGGIRLTLEGRNFCYVYRAETFSGNI